MQKVFSWMRQIYHGVTISQFKQTLSEFGIRVQLSMEALNQIKSELSIIRDTRVDFSTMKNDLPLSLLLPTITP